MGPSLGLFACSAVLFLSCWAPILTNAAPFNITAMLSAHPSLAKYNDLLTSTGVADEVNARNSITVLVIGDALLTPFLALYPNANSADVGDFLRYNVLLQYFDPTQLKTITTGNPITVTTLYQTTGRAAGNTGSVNLYNDGTKFLVGQANVNTTPNATVLRNVTSNPYNISILELSQAVVPTGFGKPATGGANLTSILLTGKNFNTLISLLQGTGVDAEFSQKETGSGITIFAPTDAAFAALPPNAMNGATAAQRKLIAEYHALTQYYPLGSLSTLNNAATPTIATAAGGAGTYVLNVSAGGNGVILNTGVSQANIGATLYDTPPTSVFAIDSILEPPAIFQVAPAPAPVLGPVPAPAPSNATVPTPAPAPSNATTPTPAPSPLTPSPTPTPTATPTPTPTPTLAPSSSPSPVPTAVSPGPPAPPAGGETPGESPGESPSDEGSDGSHASSTAGNVFITAAGVLSAAVVLFCS